MTVFVPFSVWMFVIYNNFIAFPGKKKKKKDTITELVMVLLVIMGIVLILMETMVPVGQLVICHLLFVAC